MTNRERAIVSAYTGKLMCDFDYLHKYIEEKLGRPVLTHELATIEIEDEIKAASREDFLALCGMDEEVEELK